MAAAAQAERNAIASPTTEALAAAKARGLNEVALTRLGVAGGTRHRCVIY